MPEQSTNTALSDTSLLNNSLLEPCRHWPSHKHTLRWPKNKEGGQPLTTIELSPPSLAQRQHASQHTNSDADFTEWCVRVSSGLSEKELNNLAYPDYNSLSAVVADWLMKPAEHFLPEWNEDQPQLLFPIQGDDGQLKSHYSLIPPTVKLNRAMSAYEDAWQGTLFLTAACSGFSEDELLRLSMPDWTALQNRLADFLGKSADSFPLPT